MNPRILTGVSGLVIMALGAMAILDPNLMIGFLGYGVPAETSRAAVLGEIRATYGGIFFVMGVFTFLATMNPGAQRGRLILIGGMWLGAFAARLYGITIDGNPGLMGWLSASLEAVIGSVLLLSAWLPNGDDGLEYRPPAPRIPTQPSSGAGL